MRERLAGIEYTNHMMSPEILAQKFKIQSDRLHLTFRQWGDVKSSQKDNPKIPDIFFSVPVSSLNSTYTQGRLFIVVNCFA